MTVDDGGDIDGILPIGGGAVSPATSPQSSGPTSKVNAPLAGNILRIEVQVGDSVNEGDPLIVLEAMKMETAVSAPQSGTVADISVAPGDSVVVGDTLIELG